MLEKQMWFDFCDALTIELRQSQDEGKDILHLKERAEQIQKMSKDDPLRCEMGSRLLEEISMLPIREGYAFHEPSDLDAIRHLSSGWESSDFQVNAGLYDKIYGAWLGRSAGCLLGQPVESWMQDRIIGLLKDTGNYPVTNYMSSAIGEDIRKKYGVVDEYQVYGSTMVNWINNITCMPEDDDTNYTILALKLMEQKGYEFSPDDVGECWLFNLPILHVCTAERVAYINMVCGMDPPRSAVYRNPYREYIGAQIRGDLFGYVCPGNPEMAAELAWRDASISHVKNGIYGEMFVAAMLAQAAVCQDTERVIQAGMSQIPLRSRLWAAIHEVISWKQEEINWEEAIHRIHEQYDESIGYDWCHTIPNAMIVCIGLLFGEGDLETTLGICLAAAFDTDCNCATAGSIIGMMSGKENLASKWIAPLNDQIKSGVDGFGQVRISDMAHRTIQIIKKRRKEEIGNGR